jgi:hypothetical protein
VLRDLPRFSARILIGRALSFHRRWRKTLGERGALASLVGALFACEPKVVVGTLTCPPSDGGAAGAPASGVVNEGLLPAPWQTQFDSGFCDFEDGAGFCYKDGPASYRLVTSPVHSPPFAAAFDIVTEEDGPDPQTRCVREGGLPAEAYYGAWYFIPSGTSNPDNWNLFHFVGGVPGTRLDALWDVSLSVTADGKLAAYILDSKQARAYRQTSVVAMPTERWVHLEFYLKRAADRTGQVALYQDDVELIRVTDVVTDDSGDDFGQWYVGNLALALNPPSTSVYVDDVTVRLSR